MKKFLTSLIIFWLSSICFCSSYFTNYDYILTWEMWNFSQITFANWNRITKVPNTYVRSFTGAICFADKIFYNTSQSFDIYSCNSVPWDMISTLNWNSNCIKLWSVTTDWSYISSYWNSYCYNFINDVYNDYYYIERSVTSSSLTVRFSFLYNQNPPSSCPSCPDTPSCDYSWYVLESDVTKNYCTNKYSDLIPEEDITQWYCETQFWLISPSDCPSGWTWSWTWSIMWSSFFVNDRQILGGENIYLYIPDFLSWDYTYVDWDLQIDVINEGDEQYIEDILTVQSYHPSSEDFTVSFVGFLTLVLPYALVVLFCVFIFKLIKKIFKS